MVFTRTGKSTRRESGTKTELLQSSPVHTSAVAQLPYGDDGDSDVPEEISSKSVSDINLVGDFGQQFSLFEQLQEKKRELEERKQDKARSKRRKKVRKIDKGEYRVKDKKAEFKVLTLSEGIKKSLEPRANFREELLKARTVGKRERVPNAATMRSKWI